MGEVIVEGDDIPSTWTLVNESDGELYDFSGVTKLWFTLKKHETDINADAIIGPLNSVDNADQVKYDAPTPGAGKVWVWLKAAETAGLAVQGSMFYDIQVLKDGLVNTLVTGPWPAFRHEETEGTP